MLNPAFTVKLGQQIFSGLVVTGKFDGKTPSLACATTGGKVVLHSPHDTHSNNETGQISALKFLNLNRKITSLAAGSLIPNNIDSDDKKVDLIFVGSQSNLLAYDVDRNADSFFVDVQDGVNSLVVGKVGTTSKPMVIAGGNCSILGFDAKGTESFWTVTGDNVSSLALCDFESTGKSNLIVGSDDFEIRIFRKEEVIGEITEADKVNLLTSISPGKFAYGLANGTVGVYSGSKTRLWRVKTKNKVTALHSYDLDLDGIPEIFSGWNNGSFTVRRQENGEVIFKETMDAPIAGILSSDYRMDGKEEIMICSESGEIRAYLSTDVEFGAMYESGVGKDNATDQKALNELQNQKLELLNELKLLEKTVKPSKNNDAPVGTLPPNTNLSYTLEPDINAGAVTLKVEVNTDVQIVNLIAVDLEGVVLVDREVIAISPRAQSKVAMLPIKPVKNSPCSLRIQTHVASRSLLAQLHVFETDVTLPRFSVFKQLSDFSYKNPPTGKVTFLIKESVDRFLEWIQSAFLLSNSVKNVDDKFNMELVSVCDLGGGGKDSKDIINSIIPSGHMLALNVSKVKESGETFIKVKISCLSMDLASDIVQDICRFFKISELESEADFPNELVKFEEVLKVVAECNAARLRLSADMADDSQRIKALVIRAEDSRLLVDMKSMRKSYTELNILNNQLVAGYNVRASNHENLLSALKEVNQMIQKAANLRMGKAKARVIADCRAAVKVNNLNSLFRIIKQGYDVANATNSISSSVP